MKNGVVDSMVKGVTGRVGVCEEVLDCKIYEATSSWGVLENYTW